MITNKDGTMNASNMSVLVVTTLSFLLSFISLPSANGQEDSVCARVKIQIDQRAVMTRTAVKATLVINNDPENSLVENISVNLSIKDENGKDASDKFGVEVKALTGISDINGGGTVAPGSEGKVVWQIVPTREAAMEKPTSYTFGGEFIYSQDSQVIPLKLLPTTLEVRPDPYLTLNYFHEKTVYADDPFTAPIEPSIPFSLAVMVTNSGHGTAKNFKIASSQPKIIDNDKGLMIDFKIIGSQLGTYDIAPSSLNVEFGDIAPATSKVARWLLTSTLEGQFIDYQASFEHKDDFGNPRTSLIESVNIYELIHMVQDVGENADDIPDFLARKDTTKGEDGIPDTIFTSQGPTYPVNLPISAIADGDVTLSDLTVHLTASMPSGWCYVRINDPGKGDYRLKSIVRSDGKVIPIGDVASNAWTTKRTVHGKPGSPYPETFFHLLDLDGTGSYTLEYTSDSVSPNPTIEAVPTALDFGTIYNSYSYSFHDITIYNRGATDMTFDSIEIQGVNADCFSFMQAPPTQPLSGGQNRTFCLKFKPDDVQSDKTANLVIATNDPDKPTLTIPLTGSYASRALTVTGGPLSFGLQHVAGGATEPQSVEITNTALANLNFTGYGFELRGADKSAFNITNNPDTTPLASGQKRTVSVSFDPATRGAKNAELAITTDGGDEIVVLSGMGAEQEVAVNPNILDFGKVAASDGPKSLTVQVKNVGNYQMQFTGEAFCLVGADAGAFAITNSPSSTTVYPEQFRNIEITFTPTACGSKSAELWVTTDASNMPTVVIPLKVACLNAPTANIDAPAPGTVFKQGASVVFSGSATDSEDGALSGSALVWTSDKDGKIGTGTTFSISTLSLGTHAITLTATDSDGMTDVKTISIQIRPLNNYTVTFMADPNGTIQGTAIQTVVEDSSATAVSAAPETGYHFVNWTGDITSLDSSLTVNNVTSDMVITANFAINTYTVTFDLDGKGTSSDSLVQTVNYGSGAIAPTVLANPGLSFRGWDKTFDNVTSDLTVTAQYNIDLTTNNATGIGDMTPARYLVNLGISGGQSVTNSLSESGLYDYAKYRGNQSDWWILNDGSNDGSTGVAVTYGDNGAGGSNTPPPDYFGYKFKYPVSVAKVVYTDYCFSDGGTFNGTPSLQYLSSLNGTWTTVDATWNLPYDSSFALGKSVTYTITPDLPLESIWGVRLCGDTSSAGGAWDSNGWACVTELQVYGIPNFGSLIYFDDNLAQTGTPICSNSAWKSAPDGSEIIDGNFDNSNEVWDTGDSTGDKFVGISWATPQDHIGAIGFGMTFNADGGWFVDTGANPLKVQYTTDGTTWNDVQNLNKGRYTSDYDIAAALGYSYKGSWLFTFDCTSGVIGIRLIGLPGGSAAELGGNGYISIRELQMFQVVDSIPDAFSFTAQTGMPLNTEIVSNPITVTGINVSAAIGITDGEYTVSKNDGLTWGEWTNLPGTVFLNDQVKVQQKSSASPLTKTDATLTIGGVSGTFSVTTMDIYNLTYIAGSNGTIDGLPQITQTIPEGSDGTEVTALPNANYHFLTWSDGVITAARTDKSVTADKTVTATFAIDTHTLTYTAGLGGTISGPTPQTVDYGTSGVQVTAAPGIGYHFLKWSDDVLTAARTDSNVTTDKTVTATFAINTYTVTFDLTTKGSRTNGGELSQLINYGSGAQAPIFNVEAGWTFTGWDKTFDIITADTTVTASFELATPSAPTNPGVTSVQEKQLTWTWTDNSTFETGFKVWSDPGTAAPTTLRTTTAANATNWTMGGLTPNTQYAFQTVATNSGVDSAITTNYTAYTLAAAPSVGNNVLCDRSTGTPYLDRSTFTFSNPADFGAGTDGGNAYRVTIFRYVWDTSPSYAFTGSESSWTSGTLVLTPIATGNYYLHLQSVNEASAVTPTTLDYGPFRFDCDRPKVVSASAKDATTVRVTFDKPMQEDTALTSAACYQFTSGLTAQSVAVVDASNVDITVPEMKQGQSYTLSVNAPFAGQISYDTDAMQESLNSGLGDAYANCFTNTRSLPMIVRGISIRRATGGTLDAYVWAGGGSGPGGVLAQRLSQTLLDIDQYVDMSGDGIVLAVGSDIYAGFHPITAQVPYDEGVPANGKSWWKETSGGSWVSGKPTVGGNNLMVRLDFIEQLTSPKDLAGNPVDPSHNTASFGGIGDRPQITITLPTTEPTFITGSATLDTLGGTASDTGGSGLVSVEWSSDRGHSGTATGTANWTASAVPLEKGENVITVTATDGAANTGTDVLTVNFAQYTLTYLAGAGGSISGDSPQTVNYGADGVQVTAVPGIGYHFLKWSDGVLTAARTDKNVTANKTVTATFAIDTHTLNYSAGTGGTISGPTQQTVDYGTSGVQVTAVPGIGYHFSKWSDDVLTAARTDANVTADKTVTATFAINTYTVRFDLDGKGTSSDSLVQTVNHGSAATAPAVTANPGWTFTGWDVDFRNITSVITVTAQYSVVTLTITASAGLNGSITPTATVDYGKNKTFTISPAIGYHIADVLVDNVSVGAVTSYPFTNVTANHTISATFAIDTFTLASSAGTNGSITPSATADYGASKTLDLLSPIQLLRLNYSSISIFFYLRCLSSFLQQQRFFLYWRYQLRHYLLLDLLLLNSLFSHH